MIDFENIGEPQKPDGYPVDTIVALVNKKENPALPGGTLARIVTPAFREDVATSLHPNSELVSLYGHRIEMLDKELERQVLPCEDSWFFAPFAYIRPATAEEIADWEASQRG